MIALKRIDNGIVFSYDINRIMEGQNALGFSYNDKGLIVPSANQIQNLRDDFEKDVNRVFEGKVTILSENDMDSFINDSIENDLDYPVVTLDRIYYKGNGENDIFLDCTRLQNSSKLVNRNNPNDPNGVEKQIIEISRRLKQQGFNKVLLVDDVVFSGNVLRTLINAFKKNGIIVTGIRTAISTEDAYDYFNDKLERGLRCGCILGKNVIDQVCERDFYFGIAQSGISIRSNDGKILKSPYFKPFGNPKERASIPKEHENFFSNGCLIRSIFLWKCIEDNSKRKILIRDLPEEIINTKQDERVINVLRRELIYEENVADRSNGECR